MSLKDSLKQAGEQGRDATRRALDHARSQWEDAERRIRASMRIHPRPKAAKSSFAVPPENARQNSADPALNQDMKQARASAEQAKKPNAPVPGSDFEDVKKKGVA